MFENRNNRPTTKPFAQGVFTKYLFCAGHCVQRPEYNSTQKVTFLPVGAGDKMPINHYRNKDTCKLHWDECHTSKLNGARRQFKRGFGKGREIKEGFPEEVTIELTTDGQGRREGGI